MLSVETNVALDLMTPGSWPEPKLTQLTEPSIQVPLHIQRLCFNSPTYPSMPVFLWKLLHDYQVCSLSRESLSSFTYQNSGNVRVPGWLSQLNVRLRLRSWSHGSWVRAPHQALCWQLRAWSLLWILCPPLSLPLPYSRSLSSSLSKIHIIFLKGKQQR